MGKQTYLNERTRKDQRIRIITRSSNGSETITVEAPLPETFGITVGSEYGTPFDITSVNQNLSMVMAVAGAGQKPRITMKSHFINPERSEISFEMEFVAYYDAIAEVIIPVINLVGMSLGRELSSADAIAKITNTIKDMATAVGKVFGGDGKTADITIEDNMATKATDRIFGLIDMIQGPPPTVIHFGSAMTLDRCFVSSAGVQFSNVLDHRGVPMSAKCSVTAILESPPTVGYLNGMLGGSDRYSGA